MTIAIITIVAFIAVLALAKHEQKKAKRQIIGRCMACGRGVKHDRKKSKSETIEVDKDLCIGCGRCVKQCRKHVLALTNTDGKAHVEVASPEHCTACGHCMVACPMRALRLAEKE